ncbi:MAG TPA: KilA-N domain-containing protein [Candidatus Dojkabacteria bacterium]|nr:KilA-N domain-containing protein [Candidatus Dojkabacteria bacterium]HOR05815.1 KilA-N domain-containing protein [Candidatus Dojkabacteria bacterium]HOT60725.1 KilA-N domain-containing protein [Candidatus Dojkabacteria bacterium]
MKKQIIQVKGEDIELIVKNNQDYISLTSIAKYKNTLHPDDIIKNWLRNKSTLEFLGLWEKINNANFKPVEFDGFKSQAGTNAFVITPKQWIRNVSSIGIISKPGKYGGGTYAHKDIAFEFASWISPEFKLYLIKEFQRLKEDESRRNSLDWNLTRTLAKVNYKIHTRSIKENIVPQLVTKKQKTFVYANEADVLNVALFGLTAKEWRESNPEKEGNIRDYADIRQLICLSNLESLNAELIRDGLSQKERLLKLNITAIFQMRALTGIEDPFCPLCALL